MHLSLYSDYALRVMLFVGVNAGRRVTNMEISAYYGISHEHLRKVIHQLGEGGYLRTFRGKGGGIELGKAPEHINIGQLVRFTGQGNPIIDCDDQPCVLAGMCSLHGALKQAENAFYAVLESYTLQELLKAPAMRKALAIPAVNVSD